MSYPQPPQYHPPGLEAKLATYIHGSLHSENPLWRAMCYGDMERVKDAYIALKREGMDQFEERDFWLGDGRMTFDSSIWLTVSDIMSSMGSCE